MPTVTFTVGEYSDAPYPPEGTRVTMTWEQPPAERVPWHEAYGRRVADGGYRVVSVKRSAQGWTYRTNGPGPAASHAVDEDGMVEVFVEEDT